MRRDQGVVCRQKSVAIKLALLVAGTPSPSRLLLHGHQQGLAPPQLAPGHSPSPVPTTTLNPHTCPVGSA